MRSKDSIKIYYTIIIYILGFKFKCLTTLIQILKYMLKYNFFDKNLTNGISCEPIAYT